MHTCELETQGRVEKQFERNQQTDRYHWCRGIYQRQRESQIAKLVPLLHLEREQLPASDTPACSSNLEAAVAVQHNLHLNMAATAVQDTWPDELPQCPFRSLLHIAMLLSLPVSLTLDTISAI